MEVGTDESVVAISFDENSTGKTFADTKVRYTWEVMVDGKVHRIEFTNTKTSGKKRIFVDGRLLHEMTVFRSPNFQYSWPIGGHLLSIVPVKADGTDSIFDKVMDRMANSVDCQFELRINGLPFRAFRKKPARVVPVRPARPVEHGQVVAYGHPPAAPDREYLEMRAKVEELQNRPHRPQGIEASASSGRRSSPWEASQPAKPVTKTSHGDPWKGTSSSPPQRFGDEGEEIGFTNGARAQYAGFSNSAGSSSEDDEAFTSYGPATAHAPSQSQTEWPSSSFGQSAWPSTGGVQQSGGTAGAWPSWEASPTSPFDAPAPPNRPKRQAVPTYAIPWSPQQQPPAAALPKAPVSPAMVPQAPCQATSSSMPQLLPTSTTRLAKNLAQPKALLESIGLGLSRRSSATPVQVTSGRSGHFKWPEAQVEDSRPSIASTRQRSSKLLEHRKALLGSIGLAAMATGSLSRRSARSKERKGSDIIEGTVLASHETWNEAFGESAFPLVQGNVVDSEDEVGEPILSGQPNGSGQDSHSSMTWPMSTKVAESPGFSSAFEADEAAATTLGRFPPSPGFPEASPVKDMPSGSLQQQTAQGFPASPGFPEASTAKESPLPKETSTQSGMQWPGSALPSAEVTAESSTGFPPSPGFPESSAAKESPLPKETSTPSGMQWPGSALPTAEVTAESSTGFPPSPGFPESSAAKESTLPKETSTPSGMQWPGSALPSAEVTAESPAGFPPSPGFPEASTAKESPLPKETSTPSGMQWPGSALPTAEVTAESSTGFPPSPGFPESSAAKESTLPKETSTPNGMQWPGSALSSAEVTAESSTGFPPSPGFPQTSAAKETSAPSGMQWPGSAEAAAFPGGFPEWPAQESTPGGMQWPDASLTSSKAEDAFGGFPASGSQDGPKEEAASANGHSEPADQDAEVPNVAPIVERLPPKETPKEAPKFHDKDEGEVPSWWPKGA